MREALFVLLIVFVLVALTAIKYRKQIAGMIGFAKMLKDVRADLTQQSQRIGGQEKASIPLVNCSKCGVWVPQTKAIKVGDIYFCSNHQAETRV